MDAFRIGGRLAHAARNLPPLAALLLASTLLAGCGFHLRGAEPLPFATVYLKFADNSPLGTELARNITNSTRTRVVKTAKEADAVIEDVSEPRDKVVQSFNAQGRAREYQLRLAVLLRVTDARGHELLAPTFVRAQRDISFNDTQVLAKDSEEALLYRDMQTDIVQQILRRLAALKPFDASTP